MIDHILQFTNEAAALTALGPLGFASQGRWDTSRVISNQGIISTEAVWDKTGPSPVLVAPEVKMTGFWVMIALPNVSAALKALPALSQIRDRLKAERAETYISDDKGVIASSRLAPVFAGSRY